MKTSDPPVASLANIGPTIARKLRDVGIRTRGDLERAGPAEVFRLVCNRFPKDTISVCYYLYSLEGALRGVHWDAIGQSEKLRLQREAGLR